MWPTCRLQEVVSMLHSAGCMLPLMAGRLCLISGSTSLPLKSQPQQNRTSTYRGAAFRYATTTQLVDGVVRAQSVAPSDKGGSNSCWCNMRQEAHGGSLTRKTRRNNQNGVIASTSTLELHALHGATLVLPTDWRNLHGTSTGWRVAQVGLSRGAIRLASTSRELLRGTVRSMSIIRCSTFRGATRHQRIGATLPDGAASITKKYAGAGMSRRTAEASTSACARSFRTLAMATILPSILTSSPMTADAVTVNQADGVTPTSISSRRPFLMDSSNGVILC